MNQSAGSDLQTSSVAFDALPTCIGSFPHLEAGPVCDLLARTFPRCPAWPQLPNRSPGESMYAQYAASLPGARIDPSDGKTTMSQGAGFADEMTRFYEQILAEDLRGFEPSPGAAAGYHELLGRVDGLGSEGFIKGHVTGPISFGLTVTDAHDRPVLYDETLRDVVVQGLAAQARAQCRGLARGGRRVILFVDEPYLSSFGSATIPVSEQDVIECLNVVTSAILAEGAIPGVHCCGNTDWSLLFGTSARVINFDAYSFLEGMTLYPSELESFLARGGALAWGIVPTSPVPLAAATPEDLADRLEAGLVRLEAGLARQKDWDHDMLRHRSLVTPSCGTGSLSVELAERAITLTRQVSDELRSRWGLGMW